MSEKKINDTYYGLRGEKVKISKNAKIENADLICKQRILSVAEAAGTENIVFKEIDNEIKDKVSEVFGDVYSDAADSYAISVKDEGITVYSDSENGKRYAACAIEKHYDNGIEKGILYNVPICEFRAVKVYIPGREHIGFFKKFIDLCMYYGYNTLVLEIGGAMEYKTHPEINSGWAEYCNIFKEYQGKSLDVQHSMPWNKNSIHCENGNGGFLSQSELAELKKYCDERGIEIIPEVPSLSHCDYLLINHHELAENQNDPLPDTYCPSNSKSYELLFDILNEVIELFKPRIIHIGHDEWYSFGICDKCKGKDPAEMYAGDIFKIYDFLKQKGIKTMIWGDKLLNARDDRSGDTHGGALVKTRHIPSGKTVEYLGEEHPVYNEYWGNEADKTEGGVLTVIPETYKAINLVPKDLLIMNWYYRLQKESDRVFHDNNLWSVYGNFDTGRESENWFERIAAGVHGLSISNWSMLDQRHMQRNGVLFGIAYASMMVWNREFEETQRANNTLIVAHDLFQYNNRDILSKPHIEIIHGTDIIIPHKSFVDGYGMSDETDRMGCYTIYYDDESTEAYPILWGHNIGYMLPDWYEQDKDWIGTKMVIEPTYTCDYVLQDGKVFYKLVIPTAKNVVKVEADILDKYKDRVFVDKITIVRNRGI